MECDQARELFLEYTDGDLGLDEVADLEAHLEGCADCRGELEVYRKTMDEVSGLIKIEPPADFVSRVKKTIGRRSRGRFFGEQGPFSVGFAIVSFVLILLFMLAYLFISAGTNLTLVSPEPDAGGDDATSSERGAAATRP